MVSRNEADNSALGGGLTRCERQGAHHDVRIFVFVVRVRVVPVVLVDPPAVTQSDGQIAVYQSDQIVDPAGAEDLRVPGIVANEAQLGKDEREERRHEQLPPRVTKADEDRPATKKEPSGHRHLGNVIASPPVEQTRALYLTHQAGEFTAAA